MKVVPPPYFHLPACPPAHPPNSFFQEIPGTLVVSNPTPHTHSTPTLLPKSDRATVHLSCVGWRKQTGGPGGSLPATLFKWPGRDEAPRPRAHKQPRSSASMALLRVYRYSYRSPVAGDGSPDLAILKPASGILSLFLLQPCAMGCTLRDYRMSDKEHAGGALEMRSPP